MTDTTNDPLSFADHTVAPLPPVSGAEELGEGTSHSLAADEGEADEPDLDDDSGPQDAPSVADLAPDGHPFFLVMNGDNAGRTIHRVGLHEFPGVFRTWTIAPGDQYEEYDKERTFKFLTPAECSTLVGLGFKMCKSCELAFEREQDKPKLEPLIDAMNEAGVIEAAAQLGIEIRFYQWRSKDGKLGRQREVFSSMEAVRDAARIEQ